MGRVLLQLEARLIAVARRVVRDSDAAADIVQSAFEKILLHCDQFRGGSRASTWMHRIVVNEALSWLRKQKTGAAQSTEIAAWRVEFAAPPEDPESSAIRDESRARLEQALRNLSAEDRTLLSATALDGRSLAVVSIELGLSLAAVKSRAFRARRRLARDLAGA
jgi:RNA polymerase sigma-70 factor (ECF subfamily)